MQMKDFLLLFNCMNNNLQFWKVNRLLTKHEWKNVLILFQIWTSKFSFKNVIIQKGLIEVQELHFSTSTTFLLHQNPTAHSLHPPPALSVPPEQHFLSFVCRHEQKRHHSRWKLAKPRLAQTGSHGDFRTPPTASPHHLQLMERMRDRRTKTDRNRWADDQMLQQMSK